jgi:protein phosphatase PTC6
VTHLPSSSLHPDSRSANGLNHKFPRKESTPHTTPGQAPPAAHPSVSRDTTVVRIPLKSAKHHFGVSVSRGSRPYNEDSHQAGVIELPAFAKRPPASLNKSKVPEEGTVAEGANGDPQVFYFGVFDGHGGAECSDFLREKLHEYIEKSSQQFELRSSLLSQGKSKKEAEPGPPLIQNANNKTIRELETKLVKNWKELVGGYFRRFKPAYFSIYGGYQASVEESEAPRQSGKDVSSGSTIEEVMTYAFLKADYDFVSAQAAKQDEHEDMAKAERPLNDGDILGSPHRMVGQIGGPRRFKGGSTCSIAMVSTPSPTPFWNPTTSSSMLVAHVGDTRIIVCSTATGAAIPLTTMHHPSSPVESSRLRRYAATFVTDSFGEERISGLANTRAFGDIASKRIGVSAEPEIKRIELGAAEYSFMVLISDGVSGTLSDQEVVDVVKEAKTPDQAARDVVSFATEVSEDGDNATCLVVRMGGWERRQEGGLGSLATKESRQFKREAASDPRSSRR